MAEAQYSEVTARAGAMLSPTTNRMFVRVFLLPHKVIGQPLKAGTVASCRPARSCSTSELQGFELLRVGSVFDNFVRVYFPIEQRDMGGGVTCFITCSFVLVGFI